MLAVLLCRYGFKESFGELMATSGFGFILGTAYVVGGGAVAVLYWLVTGHSLLMMLLLGIRE